MAKKAKAWRAFIDGPGEMARGRKAWAMQCLCHKGKYNATVIPDGATVPLPASVRRVMRAAVRWRKSLNPPDEKIAEELMAIHILSDAVKAYEHAVAKGRRA